MKLDIRGSFRKQGNRYLSRDDHIINRRKGSSVEVTNDTLVICADVTGIDKVYFSIGKNAVTVSDRFIEFHDHGIDTRLLGFQTVKGYVPYPFTILKGVYKAPPGLKVMVRAKKWTYEASADLKIFSAGASGRKRFRKDFEQILRRSYRGRLVSSFSAGFDSLLLTDLYQKQCGHIMHFSQDGSLSMAQYKARWPNVPWTILGNDSVFTNVERDEYFRAIDEPNSDAAGFAEFLMVKKVFTKTKLAIMNGQGADALYCNGRQYFRELVSPKILQSRSADADDRLWRKMQRYLIGTKARFYSFYAPEQSIDAELYPEIDRIYDAYRGAIKNDSVNFLAAITFLMYYPLHGIEKMKTASRATGATYYLPFMCPDMIRLAFAIPGRQKAGPAVGKRILRNAFPEIRGYHSGAFSPRTLLARFTANHTSFEKYYIDQWMRYHHPP